MNGGMTPDPGLCAGCRFHRVVRNRGGSRFWLCRLAAQDPRFPRYPRLPVLRCAGFSAAGAPPAAGGAAPREGPVPA